MFREQTAHGGENVRAFCSLWAGAVAHPALNGVIIELNLMNVFIGADFGGKEFAGSIRVKRVNGACSEDFLSLAARLGTKFLQEGLSVAGIQQLERIVHGWEY